MLLFSDTARKKLAIIIGFAVLVLSIVLLAGSGADRIHLDSIARQWHGKKVISYENTLYQNIVVARNQDQLTFYTDGTPVMTTPVPDITFVEEFSHISLLSHPNPESILVLGGGSGGVIHEILKHPSVKAVDYVEIDPQFLITVKKFSTPLSHQDLTDKRVIQHYTDGRIFVKKTTRKYDAILLGIAPPLTLQANRFFTQEFFKNIRNTLNDRGILSLYLTGSTSYYSHELRYMNACMYRTVKSVLPNIFAVPGDVNLYIASLNNHHTDISSLLLSKRIAERGIKTNLINQVHLDYRFQEDRRQWYISLVDLPTAPINRDFEPKGLYYNILFNNLLFTPYLKSLFNTIVKLNIYTVAAIFGAIFLIFLSLQKKYQTISLPFAITTTGFTSMVLQLILLFGFQIVYGYVFYEIGILITAFMAGLAIGGILTATWPSHGRRKLGVFMKIEFSIVLLSIILIFFFRYLEAGIHVEPIFIRIAFLFLLLISGLFTGMEFPLANRLYIQQTDYFSFRRDDIGKTVGLLYCVDLLGGWVGGVLGGFLLIPTLGITQACAALAILKICSFLLLFTFPRK
jgi:spermidine synthase